MMKRENIKAKSFWVKLKAKNIFQTSEYKFAHIWKFKAHQNVNVTVTGVM